MTSWTPKNLEDALEKRLTQTFEPLKCRFIERALAKRHLINLFSTKLSLFMNHIYESHMYES